MVPKKMRAAAIDHYGGPEEVHTEQVEVPRPGPSEVLIEVAVAGVGEWDPALVSGELKVGEGGFPLVFGSDGAGTIAAVGSRVKRLKVGDRVYGWGFGNRKGGFFAEYAAVAEKDAALIPAGLSVEQAGGLAVCGITALEGVEALRLAEGDTIAIIGASGAVGHIAVQLAKRLGLIVFAVASGPDGVELAGRIGADAAVDGHSDEVASEAQSFAPLGYDGALVFAGRSDGWRDVLSQVRRGGIVAFPHGVDPEPQPPRGVRCRGYDGRNTAAAFDRLNRIAGADHFSVKVSGVYPLDDAARALRDVEKHHLGKLILRIKRN